MSNMSGVIDKSMPDREQLNSDNSCNQVWAVLSQRELYYRAFPV